MLLGFRELIRYHKFFFKPLGCVLYELVTNPKNHFAITMAYESFFTPIFQLIGKIRFPWSLELLRSTYLALILLFLKFIYKFLKSTKLFQLQPRKKEIISGLVQKKWPVQRPLCVPNKIKYEYTDWPVHCWPMFFTNPLKTRVITRSGSIPEIGRSLFKK